MSLAFLALSLTCILPARAQGPAGGDGPPADEGHYWKVTYSSSGSASMHYLYGNQYNAPVASSSAWGGTSNGGGIGGQYAVDGTTSGTVTATLTWIPAAGQTLVTDPPASPVHIIETASASWSATPAFGNSGQDPLVGTDASDGLGDPKVATQNGQTSSGTHLIQKDGLTGTIILDPVQMNANSTPCPTPVIWCYAGANASLYVSVDGSQTPRSVRITADIDPTYHKDPVTGKTPNVAASDGTMTADSVNRVANINNSLSGAFGGPTITYSGHADGNWDPYSSYHWYSAVTGKSDAGTFAIPTFPVYYPDLVTSKEHINLHCIDAGDGASATANYYVNWHNEWEGLTLDAPNMEVIDTVSKVQYNGTDYPAQENHSNTQQMAIGPFTVNTTATAALSVQFNGSFKLSDFVTLGGNFQPSLSIAIQAGQAVTGPPVDPLYYVQLYFHVHFHRNHWLTDHYNTSGFDQTYTEVVDGDEKYISLYWGHQESLGGSGLGGH